MAPMFTYFIQREDGGPIKIGKTRDIKRRLDGLQTGSPVTLVCFAYFERDCEDELHLRFRRIRLCGEWFRDDPELRQFVAAHAIAADIRRPPLDPEVAHGKRFGWADFDLAAYERRHQATA